MNLCINHFEHVPGINHLKLSPVVLGCATRSSNAHRQLPRIARRVPGSHNGGVPSPQGEERMAPLPNEQLLAAKAGDCVILHSDTLHSTTVNVAAPVRYFISAYFTRFGFPHRDEFDTPAVRAIVAAARSTVRTLMFATLCCHLGSGSDVLLTAYLSSAVSMVIRGLGCTNQGRPTCGAALWRRC
eukprot:COSAG02_NODE_11120_length_1789_cov_1.159172_1_plen_185_part_00